MSDLAVLLEAIAQLIWPLISIILLVIFYKPLKILLKDINNRHFKIKVGDSEIEVGEYIKQQTDLISEIQLENIIPNSVSDTLPDYDEFENSKIVYQDNTVALNNKNNKKSSNININKKIPSINIIKRNRILWVDDNPLNNAAIAESLRSRGYNVDISRSTADALQSLSKKTYDLIISDMGRIENGHNNNTAGIDLTKQIRYENKQLPIIIFTTKVNTQRYGNDQNELNIKLTASGAELLKLVYKSTIT